MDVLIAAPVLARGWILEAWSDHAAAAADKAGLDARFLLLGGEADRDTWDAADRIEHPLQRVYIDEPLIVSDREWHDRRRLERMVDLRNQLLTAVRAQTPGYLLSLDTDVLLHPDAVASMRDLLDNDRYAAVGGYCHMSPGRSNPSYAWITRGNGTVSLRREPIDGRTCPVDVIMAIKLMSPAAYAVDYEYERHGEDIGWSLACRRAGLKLAVDARVINKHCMDRAALNHIDPRCGF